MDMNSIFARNAAGFAVKAAAAVAAIYAASQVWAYVSNVFGAVSTALPL